MRLTTENEGRAVWQAYAHSRDVSLRNQLVLENMALVQRISSQYAAIVPDVREDLFQEGCIALIRAVERFRPEYGLQFSTYAYPVISGMIKNYLRRRRRLLGRLMSVQPEIDEQSGGDLLSVAGEALTSPADLEEVVSDAAADFSERVVDRILTEALLARIPVAECRMLRQMFYDDLTQREIARQMARSASRVSRLARSALARVRTLLVNLQEEERTLAAKSRGIAPLPSNLLIDPETGLFGPAHFRRCLYRELKRAEVHQAPLTLVLMRAESPAGVPRGTVMARTAEKAYRRLRVLDHIFRSGRSELGVLLPLPSHTARQVCQRLAGGDGLDSVSSLAMVSYPEEARSTSELIDLARKRLRPF